MANSVARRHILVCFVLLFGWGGGASVDNDQATTNRCLCFPLGFRVRDSLVPLSWWFGLVLVEGNWENTPNRQPTNTNLVHVPNSRSQGLIGFAFWHPAGTSREHPKVAPLPIHIFVIGSQQAKPPFRIHIEGNNHMVFVESLL